MKIFPPTHGGYKPPKQGDKKTKKGWEDKAGKDWQPTHHDYTHDAHYDVQPKYGGKHTPRLSVNRMSVNSNMNFSIKGHLEIKSYNEDGVPHVSIHGDPEGLRSFANLIEVLADLDQMTLTKLPEGAREHVHLDPNWQISKSSHRTIVGRLDAKLSKDFPFTFKPRKKTKD